MPLILNIDTATDYGAVGLFEDKNMMGSRESDSQKEHASFLQPAIRDMMKQAGRLLKDIDAIAVTIGPGSYTGLRVGLASAKGLCYALDKPLITLNTLQVMALAAIEHCVSEHRPINDSTLFCPMIDARRMEVFSALFDAGANQISPPEALVIDETIYDSVRKEHSVIFSGNGSVKLTNMLHHPNVSIIEVRHTIGHMAPLALLNYNRKVYADIAYCEPFYLKAFYTSSIGKK